MRTIEAGGVCMDEVEYHDETLPHVGFTLEARATYRCPLGGGVLADVMGGGKTVTALALIAAGRKRAAEGLPKGSPHQLKATLVVAPPILLQQWDDERKKFTGDKLRSIVIRSPSVLQQVSLEQMRKADLILVVSDLLGVDKKEALDPKDKELYLSHLASVVGLDAELPDMVRYNVRQAGGEPDVFEGIWLPGFGANPYAGTNGRQCDRHAAALFTKRYQDAVDALRQKRFPDSAKGVPLEYFVFERVIVDECHVPICLASSAKDHVNGISTGGESKFEKAALSSNRSSCAVRELLGVSTPDVSKRPLRWRRAVWGLTGTPLLTSATRITELASMCAAAYTCGGSAHWRTMERASLRDVFLRYHEACTSRLYTSHCVQAAQQYIQLAIQRNKADEFVGVECTPEIVAVAVGAAEAPEVWGKSWAVLEESKLEEAAETAAKARSRQAALQQLVGRLQAEDPGCKLVVFSPSGAAFDAARAALERARVPAACVLEGDDAHNQATLHRFTQLRMGVATRDPTDPLILLLSFEHAAGLNLQYVCHHVVLYAPLWAQDTVAAVANEQQAIGRVFRYGQTKNVTVHRLLMKRDGTGAMTVDEHLFALNTNEDTIKAATNI